MKTKAFDCFCGFGLVKSITAMAMPSAIDLCIILVWLMVKWRELSLSSMIVTEHGFGYGFPP